MTVVLDASAVIAYLRDEPGADQVDELITTWIVTGQPAAAVSAVNWIEIAQRVGDSAVLSQVADALEIAPLDRSTAETAASMHATTRTAGLSLGDRACLALARERGVPALTADRAWAGGPSRRS